MAKVYEEAQINPDVAGKEMRNLETLIEEIGGHTLKEGTDMMLKYLTDISREKTFVILYILGRDYMRRRFEKEVMEELIMHLSGEIGSVGSGEGGGNVGHA